MMISDLTARALGMPDETGGRDNVVHGPGRTWNDAYDFDPYNEMRQPGEMDGPRGRIYYHIPDWSAPWGVGAAQTQAHARENYLNSAAELRARPGYLPGMGCNKVDYDIYSPQIYQRGLAQPIPNNNQYSKNG